MGTAVELLESCPMTNATLDDKGLCRDIRHQVVNVSGVEVAIPSLQIWAPQADEVSPPQDNIKRFTSVFGTLPIHPWWPSPMAHQHCALATHAEPMNNSSPSCRYLKQLKEDLTKHLRRR